MRWAAMVVAVLVVVVVAVVVVASAAVSDETQDATLIPDTTLAYISGSGTSNSNSDTVSDRSGGDSGSSTSSGLHGINVSGAEVTPSGMEGTTTSVLSSMVVSSTTDKQGHGTTERQGHGTTDRQGHGTTDRQVHGTTDGQGHGRHREGRWERVISSINSGSGSSSSSSSRSDRTLVWPSDAALYLGAVFPIHATVASSSGGLSVCTHIQGPEGIQPLEMMLFTLDEVNSRTDLLPGVTLGALVLDSCDHPSMALNHSLRFIKGYLSGQHQHHEPEFTCRDGSSPTFLGGQYDRVVGIIGGQQSSVSSQMASVLRVIQMPQISYLSTSASLSNVDRYPYFLRTVPSDTAQAQAILSIMREMGWKYASVVYSEGEYGEEGYLELSRRAAQYNVCLASPALALAPHYNAYIYNSVVDQLLEVDTNVVVVFAVKDVAEKLLKTVKERNMQSRFVWLGSDGWSYTDPKGVESVAEGALGLLPLAREVPGFDEYFTSLSPETNTRNPWFQEYWSRRYHRTDPSSSVATPDYKQQQWLHFVRDAVYAYAWALHSIWEEECGGQEGVCEGMVHGSVSDGHLHGQHLFTHLLNLSFTGSNNETFMFGEDRSGPPRYTIFNYQRVDDDTFSWSPVGTYCNAASGASRKDDLSLTKDRLQWRSQQAFPVSSCTNQCAPGQAKIPLRDSCCWRCEDCQDNQFVNDTSHLCQKCPDECMISNDDKTSCVPKHEKYIDYGNSWAITSLAFASLGLFSTVLVGVIFWVNLDTPVIKASSRELSYILLGGVAFSFCMSFIIVAPPAPLTCGLTRFFMGFSYTLCYAAILTKTNRIARIFNRNPDSKSKSHKTKYTSPQSQVVIVMVLVSVEVVVNVCWLVLYPPKTMHLCSRHPKHRILICEGLEDYSYIVGFAYPLILVALCTLYAIKTRKCPGGFNEARYIAFTNYTTCLIWLIFVPLYMSTGSSDDIRIATLALSLSLGAFVQLGCLFFPKVYVVLFKPEKNTRDAVMNTNRNSTCILDENFCNPLSGGHFGSTSLSSPAMYFMNGAEKLQWPGQRDSSSAPPAGHQNNNHKDGQDRVDHFYNSTIHPAKSPTDAR